MPTAWRQGDLLVPDNAVALGVIAPAQRDTHRALVVSHSCDIANEVKVEPTIELLIGIVVHEHQATSQNGHSIRNLHLGAEGEPAIEWVHYKIAPRREVSKADVLQYEPWTERRYTSEQRALLRRWLAQRYARSEFPDSFINWLRDSGAASRFEQLGKRHSAHLVGIYFDLDDDTERQDPDDPYALGINLVYEAGNAQNDAAADQARGCLEALFNQCCKKNGKWRWIELTYCDSLSEEAFTLRAARTFRRWRFEHRSLGGEAVDTAE
ncbi:MAG: hypothetical protein AB7V26_01330 [Lysobacterales bacterium]